VLSFSVNTRKAKICLKQKMFRSLGIVNELLCKLSKLEFLTSAIKLISFTMQIQCFAERQNIYAKENASRGEGSVLSPTLYNMYINDAPKHLVFT
jgi:hypothetical protein